MGTQDIGVLEINTISETRKRFDVSTEAVLLRIAHLSDEPCAVFTASRREASHGPSAYWFDYVIPTRSWKHNIGRGTMLPDPSPASECTAIGFTAKGSCEFPEVSGKIRMECIGIPPYPGAIFPRIAGFLAGRKRAAAAAPGINFLRGDVLKPRGTDRRLIAHVVSDATPNWGGRGIAMSLKNKWPAAQEMFRDWVGTHHRPNLGEVHFCQVAENIEVASMVCQHGYGASSGPRLRYAALESALTAVAEHAKLVNASVHLPRIGCGQAGGSWMVVQELIATSLVAANAAVTVYDLPEEKNSGVTQLSLASSTQQRR
jgi:O-acetyl-ADP-ribose deacetylase (regulator of RNase III)